MNEIGTKNRILYVTSMIIILLAIFMICVAAYWAFVPVKVIVPQVQPYPVITKTVKVGETFTYQVTACKYKEAIGNIVRSFVDENNTAYPIASSQGTVKTGCAKTNVSVIVPTLHSGKWHMSLDVGYKVNPIRTEYYHLTTDNFEIVN